MYLLHLVSTMLLVSLPEFLCCNSEAKHEAALERRSFPNHSTPPQLTFWRDIWTSSRGMSAAGMNSEQYRLESRRLGMQTLEIVIRDNINDDILSLLIFNAVLRRQTLCEGFLRVVRYHKDCQLSCSSPLKLENNFSVENEDIYKLGRKA